VDAGRAPGTSTADAARIGRLEREVKELKRANEILLAASSFFASPGVGLAFAVVVAFVDDHKARFGVQPICRVLSAHGVKIAPSGYYAHKARPASARSVRDGELTALIRGTYSDPDKGCGVYGYRKMWPQLRRDGLPVARCTVARLMRAAGLAGVVRGRQFRTTRPDPAATRPPDLESGDGERGAATVLAVRDCRPGNNQAASC